MPELYFEDLEAGQVVDLGTIAVTEEDILGFARQWDPQPFHLGEDADHIAQVNGRDELHPLDGDRRHRSAGPARGDDAGGNVHLRQYPAAEDMAVGVDVAWPLDDAEDGILMVEGHSRLSVYGRRRRRPAPVDC